MEIVEFTSEIEKLLIKYQQINFIPMVYLQDNYFMSSSLIDILNNRKNINKIFIINCITDISPIINIYINIFKYYKLEKKINFYYNNNINKIKKSNSSLERLNELNNQKNYTLFDHLFMFIYN